MSPAQPRRPSTAKTTAPARRRAQQPDPRITAIFDTLAERIDPKTELLYGSTYQLLVAVVCSAQTTDVAVNRATGTLFPAAPTPAAMVALGEAGVLSHIKRIGLAPTKARHVVALSRLLLERHGGEVPQTRAELEALPGVGRKTAAVVLNTAFGQPLIAVDTHVHRVANRLELCTTNSAEATEAALEAVVPRQHLQNAHHLLILHGRYTCTARKPNCPGCSVAKHCPQRGVAG